MPEPQPSSGPSAPHPDDSKLSRALDYARRDWAVLPLHSVEEGRCTCGNATCTSPGKHQRPQLVLKEASAHTWHINRWWRWWPGSNVGIATGVTSGLVVLDIHPQNGGDASYEQLRKQLPAAFMRSYLKCGLAPVARISISNAEAPHYPAPTFSPASM